MGFERHLDPDHRGEEPQSGTHGLLKTPGDETLQTETGRRTEENGACVQSRTESVDHRARPGLRTTDRLDCHA